MKLSAGTVLSALLVTTPLTSAWSCGPSGRYGGVVMRTNPFVTGSMLMDDLLTTTPEEFRQRRRRNRQEFFDRAFTRISPQYAITETENEIKISLDVPGVKAEDIEVTLEEDGKVLSVTGRREKIDTGKDGSQSSYTRKFAQSFTMDPTVDIEKFSASLQNGVLVITAPKDLQRIEKNIRRIPITDFSADATTVGDASSAATDNTSPADETNTDKTESDGTETSNE